MDNEAMRIANEQPNSNMIFSAQEVFFRIDLKKKKEFEALVAKLCHKRSGTSLRLWKHTFQILWFPLSWKKENVALDLSCSHALLPMKASTLTKYTRLVRRPTTHGIQSSQMAPWIRVPMKDLFTLILFLCPLLAQNFDGYTHLGIPPNLSWSLSLSSVIWIIFWIVFHRC